MFTTNGHRSLVPIASALLVMLGLCASAALAASHTVSVPNEPQFGVQAIFVPGSTGRGKVMAGGDWDDDLVFTIRFSLNGTISINGDAVGSAVLTDSYTVSSSWSETPVGWVADTTITHTASGTVVAEDYDRFLGEDDAQIIIVKAASIANLTVE